MTAFGSLLATLAGLLHGLVRLALSPSALTGATATTAMTALAATVLAGAMIAAGLALLTSLAGVGGTEALPQLRHARALREKSWRAAFLRQRDPDAAGRARPRAPSAAPAAALSR
jgi:Family of unknown function (DUF6412)